MRSWLWLLAIAFFATPFVHAHGPPVKATTAAHLDATVMAAHAIAPDVVVPIARPRVVAFHAMRMVRVPLRKPYAFDGVHLARRAWVRPPEVGIRGA